jgi:hypothetical protein
MGGEMSESTFTRKKTATSTFSQPSLVSSTTPTLANPTRGFGITNNVIQKAADVSIEQQEVQAANEGSSLEQLTIQEKPLTHDISRISFHRPQAKLTVGEPGDQHEQEADWVADRIMRMAIPNQVNTSILQPGENFLQRKCAACEEEEKIQTKPLLQRSSNGSLEAGDNIESRLNSSKGGGSPLGDTVRSFMEPRFGADFSSVRVHTDNTAVQMNRELGAQAFTHGSDVYFGAGKAPGNNELTAHELTHVVQQTGGVISKRPLNFPSVDLQEEASKEISSPTEMRTKAIAQSEAKPKNTASNDLTPKKVSTPQSEILTRKQNVHQPSLMRQQTEDTPTTTTAPKNVENLQQQSYRTSKVQPMIQRDNAWDSMTNFVKGGVEGAINLGEAAVEGVSNAGEAALDMMSNFGEDTAWKIIGNVAPELEPILRQGGGILEWMKNLIGSSLEGVFNGLMTPVRSIGGVENQLIAHFAPMLTSLQTAATQIANNDCTPISEAAAKIEKVAQDLITPIVEKLQPIIATIKDFFSGVWEKIGAPIWGWIQEYAAEQWAKIQQLGDMLTKVTSWIWTTTGGEQMWNWLKNKLGIGDGVDGKDGLVQWVERKVNEAWKAIAEKLEPFKKELTQIGLAVGAVAIAVSPAGPVLAVGAAVAEAVQGIRWIAANWGKGNIIVQSREYLEKTLIPSLQGAANRLGTTFKQMAGGLSSALGNLADGMTKAVGAIGGSFIKAATSAVQWIADKVKALADWAQQQLNSLTQFLEAALDKLQIFLQKMLDLFMEVGKVVLDIWLLPAFLGKEVWNAIPECIRTPIIDFIGPIILRQIEIFQALASDDQAWQQTKADVLEIVDLVFTNHDLMGAIKATFHLILRVFNIPPDLLVTIIQKAESAWDIVSKDPLEFIKNVVRTIGKGFGLLWDNIGEHLKFGLVGWLSGGLAENNITLPENWTEPKQVFGFVLDVMGLTVDHVWELIENHFEDKNKVRKLRKRIGQVTRVIEWIDKAIDTTKSPAENTAGIIEQAKDFGSSILTGIAEWIASKVATELAVLAAAAAASGGLSQVVDIIRRIYKAIVTAVRWARQILEMVNETLDNIGAIAGGNIAAAGATFEQIMRRGMPVVIGFLADQVGLGGIGSAIKDIVTPLRATVDKVINWIIEKLKAGIEAVIETVKSGVDAVVQWWRNREKVGQGEESHTLYVQGGEDSADLIIESTPQKLSQFIKDIKLQPRYQEPTKQTAIVEVEIKVTEWENLLKERRQAKKSEETSVMEEKDIAIDSVFKIIIAKLEIVFSGGNDLYGTREDPIPLSWPGPDSRDYPTLYFGGRLPVNKRPRSQLSMQKLYSSNTLDDTGTAVQEYKPHERKKLPDGETIGLTSEFYVSKSNNTIVGPLTTETTEGGDKLERLILPYGFSGSEDDMDLDHVHEIQFGGLTQNDKVENLWPLKSSINRSKGSRLSRASVEYPKGVQTTIDNLKNIQTDEVRNRRKFFFKIN